MSGATPFRTLLAVNLLLLLLLGAHWLLGDTRWEPPPGLPPAMEAADTFDPRLLPGPQVESLAATRGRPLFWAGRRPVDEAALGADSPSDQPEPETLRNLHIVGVVIDYAANETIKHLIVRIDNEVRRMKVGERIGAWTLVDITGTVARFERDGETQMVEMERSTMDEGRRATPKTTDRRARAKTTGHSP